jgi:glutamate racemase
LPDSRPIGVFDSGIGGLTVLSALSKALPREDLLYLGDTARVPYGTRSGRMVLRYSQQVADHLWQSGIKALVIACNTASTHALEPLQAAGAAAGVPVFGVIAPGVTAASAHTRNRHVAVLGTEATIRGGRYQSALRALGIETEAVPCPLFVALAEEGWSLDPVAVEVARRYLAPLVGGPDTVILGCTHYPILKKAIAQVLPAAFLVDSAQATAGVVSTVLAEQSLLTTDSEIGSIRYQVTDNEERFRRVGTHFLGQEPTPVERIDLAVSPRQFGEPA